MSGLHLIPSNTSWMAFTNGKNLIDNEHFMKLRLYDILIASEEQLNYFTAVLCLWKMYRNYFTENQDQCLSTDLYGHHDLPDLCGPRDPRGPHGLHGLDDPDDPNDHSYHPHGGQL